jgi:hypothetical protein
MPCNDNRKLRSQKSICWKRGRPSPTSSVHKEQSRALTNAFLDGFEKLNVDLMFECWHENGVQIYPHSSDGHINQLEGKDTIQRKYLNLVGCFNSVRIPDRTFHFEVTSPIRAK